MSPNLPVANKKTIDQLSIQPTSKSNYSINKHFATVSDPGLDSGGFWIRIRIRNPDPDPGA